MRDSEISYVLVWMHARPIQESATERTAGSALSHCWSPQTRRSNDQRQVSATSAPGRAPLTPAIQETNELGDQQPTQHRMSPVDTTPSLSRSTTAASSPRLSHPWLIGCAVATVPVVCPERHLRDQARGQPACPLRVTARGDATVSSADAEGRVRADPIGGDQQSWARLSRR